jgi:hypothetical protein
VDYGGRVRLRGLLLGVIVAGALAVPSAAQAGGSTTVSQCKGFLCKALGSLDVGSYQTLATVGDVLYIACGPDSGPQDPVRVCEAHNTSGGGNYVELVGTSLPGAETRLYVHHTYFDRHFKGAVQVNADSVEIVSRCEGVTTGTCLDP